MAKSRPSTVGQPYGSNGGAISTEAAGTVAGAIVLVIVGIIRRPPMSESSGSGINFENWGLALCLRAGETTLYLGALLSGGSSGVMK